jgi:hypothetical protein
MEKKIRLVTSAATLWNWLLVAGLAAAFSSYTAEASDISIRWQTNANPVTVDVTGIKANSLRQLQTADWQRLLSVYAAQGDFKTDMNVPPMLGDYRVENGLLRFVPKFPLVVGVKYRAVFRPGQSPGGDPCSGSGRYFPTSDNKKKSDAVVTRIFPSADVLPENLLKFYIHFSAPMQGGNIYEHIRLLNEAGKPVELPFLEIDEELWNPGHDATDAVH